MNSTTIPPYPVPPLSAAFADAPAREAPAHSTTTHDLSAFDASMRLRGLADATRAEYRRYLGKLAARAGVHPDRLGEEEVREHLLWLLGRRRYSANTIRIVHGALRFFYRVHLGRDWRLLNVVRAPREARSPRALSRAQVARLFAEVREPRFRVLLRLIYGCGLRVGEALGLEIGDLEPEGPYVLVRRGKGGRRRRVPLPAALAGEVRTWWLGHRNPRWLFPASGPGWVDGAGGLARLGRAARPMGPGTVQTRLRRARLAAGLPAETTPHTLRHSYATHLLEEGVCIRVISACLGHATLQTTLIYARVTVASEAAARRAAGALLAGLAPPGGV